MASVHPGPGTRRPAGLYNIDIHSICLFAPTVSAFLANAIDQVHEAHDAYDMIQITAVARDPDECIVRFKVRCNHLMCASEFGTIRSECQSLLNHLQLRTTPEAIALTRTQ